MRSTSTRTVLATLILGLACLPALATADEVEVRVQETSFSWSGKQDGAADFEWSAVVDNPGRREMNVEVRLDLLDDTDAVIATESVVVTLDPEARTPVGGTGSLPYPEARRADLFRIGLRPPEDGR